MVRFGLRATGSAFSTSTFYRKFINISNKLLYQDPQRIPKFVLEPKLIMIYKRVALTVQQLVNVIDLFAGHSLFVEIKFCRWQNYDYFGVKISQWILRNNKYCAIIWYYQIVGT